MMIRISLIAYASVALLTFGYAAAHYPAEDCKPWCISGPTEQRAAAGVFAAMLWPLYWSWTAFALTAPGEGEAR